MPSLRQRAEDVPLLLNELISIMESEQRGSVRFNSGAIASLCRHPWLGNVRELANLVERMAIMHPHGIVGVNELPESFRHLGDAEASQLDVGEEGSAEQADVVDIDAAPSPQDSTADAILPLSGLDLKEYLANLEKGLIAQALSDSGGVVARAANRLQLHRTTLVEKIRKYKLAKKAGTGEELAQSQMADDKAVDRSNSTDPEAENQSTDDQTASA